MNDIDKLKVFRCIACRKNFFVVYGGSPRTFVCSTCSRKRLYKTDEIDELFKEKF